MEPDTRSTARHVVRPPGLHRIGVRPAGWVDDDGVEVRDGETLARLAALRVPPAWTHVWAASTGEAALQATGVDARGRTQYLYSAEAVALAEGRKFGSLMEFALALPRLRERVAADLSAEDAVGPVVPLTAAAVRLLDQGLFRVGSTRYARDNHTFGLTTLTRAHVSVDSDALSFDFVGKEHIAHHITVRDAAAAGVIRRRLERDDGDGSPLFSTAEHPTPRRIDSVTVNSYIHAHSGAAASAKTFRTWGATVAAAAVAGGARFEGGMGTRTHDELAPYHAAASLLGDSLAVARRSYVHPSAISVGSTAPVRDAVAVASTEAGSDTVEAILRAEVLRKAVYDGLLSTES
ncbi:DNA topoisomerase IB [Leifsonia sp. 2MCAF36]|uniref:DNA topoisomerase IB n=1 Tax=Leifsonia sp. 2MCAF36 TaxID=3232988 RepID=UPI003F963E70